MSSLAAWCSVLLFSAAAHLAGGERLFNTGRQAVELHAGVETNTSQLAYWHLFGQRGPRPTDIQQGKLGDCYYLAGLAAIAQTHPEIIEQAFIMQGQTSRTGLKVYQVRFLVDGAESVVALDEKVPMREEKFGSHAGRFYFASASGGDGVWPVLLEKGFAKLFGSYLAIRGGHGYDPFKALTQAPVDVIVAERNKKNKYTWPDPEKLWDTITEALDTKFPIVAHSTENSFGTAASHAFAVMGHGSVDDEKTITVYNPWASNRYKGKLKDQANRWKGTYTLTFEEFQEAFCGVDIARVRANHRISSVRVPVGEPVALEFTVTHHEPFAVQLEWPTKRFTKIFGCRLAPRYVKLLVRREGSDRWSSGEEMRHKRRSNLRVDLKQPGTYLVYAYLSFAGAPVAAEVAVNVYGGQDVSLERLHDPLAVGREILGFPCTFLVKPGLLFSIFDDVYEAVPFPVGGSPAWKKRSSKKVMWHDEDGLTRSPSLEQLSRTLPGFPFDKLECRPEGHYEESPEDQVEPVEEVLPSGCGFEVGDAVLVESDDEWICGEVDDTIPNYKHYVTVRYHTKVTKNLNCMSDSLKSVTQCPFSQRDQVEYRDGHAWVSGKVAEVGCGEVTLAQGGQVACGRGLLRYPHDCPVYKGETVVVWDEDLKQWRVARAQNVAGSQVTVLYKGRVTKLPCSDRSRLRKVSWCEQVAHEQIERSRALNNVDEIMNEGRDSLFPPKVDSIGPLDADCSDSAQKGGPQWCSQFNTWGAISQILF